MTFRLGTMQDVDDICQLVSDAITEMERHEIYQWDEIWHQLMNAESIRELVLFFCMKKGYIKG